MVAHRRHATKLRREEIIEATRNLIINSGSESLTIRAIAKKVGITEGAIYRHFKNKKEILLVMADGVGKELLADFNRNPQKGKSPLETLEILLRLHLLGIAENREGKNYAPSLEQYRLHDFDLNQRMVEGVTNITGRYKEFLSQGVESGEVRKDLDLDAAAMLIGIMISGLLEMWILNNHAFALEEKFTTMWQVFRSGIAKS